MRRIFLSLAIVLLSVTLWAQSPQKLSYQSVIRGSDNKLVVNKQIGIQISILQGSDTGDAVYVETQEPTSNGGGLISIEIGAGTSSDKFTDIDWSKSVFYIKTEIDPLGGTDYTITGVSQLLSVPYALHAKTAESITGNIEYTETDPSFLAWDKSAGIKITKSQITDLGSRFESEIDPLFVV